MRGESCNFALILSAPGSLQAVCQWLFDSPDGLNILIYSNLMYAIVEIQGQQFKAEAGKFLYVHFLGDKVKEGDVVEFDQVLLADNDGDVKVGAPTVEGAKVVCEVATPLVKGDKVIVFKKKRRKGYRRLNGHRQYFTKIVIKNVVA